MTPSAKLRFVILMTVIWSLVSTIEMKPYQMNVDRAQTCNPSSPLNIQCRLTAPIATLELARSSADFLARIDQQVSGRPYDATRRSGNLALIRVNTYLDFLFIALYTSAFWLLALTVPGILSKWVKGLILLTALLDVVENALLLTALKTIEQDSSNFTPPGWESSLKWCCLAASSILLGFAIFKAGTVKRKLVGIPLLVSGVSTLLGLFSFALLGVGALLLFLVLLVQLILLLPPRSEWLAWLNYIYFIRFSLVLWFAMPLLALLDWSGATTAITLGILSPDGFLPIFYCTFFIVASGWLSLTLARIVCAYGEERFGTKPPPGLHVGQTMRWSTFLVAQLPGVALLTRVALNACVQTEISPSTIALAMFIGAIAAFIFWLLVAVLYYWTYVSTYTERNQHRTTASAFLIPSSSFLKLDQMAALPNPPVASGVRVALSWTAERLGDGYKRPGAENHKLHSGHGIALFLFSAYFAVYIGLMGITSPLPMPLVVSATRLLIGILIIAGIVNYLIGGSESEKAQSANPVKLGYRFLSRLAAFTLVAVAIVVFWQPRADRAFSVIASIFVLFTFSTLALSGLAFWADRFRIPVLTTTIVLLTATNVRYLRADHQFDAVELSQAATAPTPDQVLASMEPDGKVRPLIIITATGGGIHAAMWTSEVLNVLEWRFPKTDLTSGKFGFHDSILLTSTVSGGSVGMMNFLREYKSDSAFDSANLDDHLVATAACSSLEAVAWGLIYPDLTRLVAPGFFKIFPRFEPYDRGYALEQSLYYNRTDPSCNPSVRKLPMTFSDDNLQLSTLHPGRAESGTTFFPAFTLNTTVSETGDRFLLANYQVEATGGAYCGGAPNGLHSDLLVAESFLQSYAERCPGESLPKHLADLRLSTAARLSASFTYVSPATRIQPLFAPNAYHFVDGGYFDNDGTGSVIEFLQAISVAGKLSKDRLQPILLIEIRNGSDVYSDQSPDSYSCQQRNCASSTKPTPWGPWRQMVAPAQAMYLAGHESITRRNRRELCLLESDLAPRSSDNSKSNTQYGGLAIHHVVFSIDDAHAALSWHLTAAQKDFIRANAPDVVCRGSSCYDQNASTDKGTVKSLEDALAWFGRAQRDPQSLLADYKDNQTSPVCRVYP